MTDDNWPKHPDGRSKRIGEMTPEEADRVFRDAAARLKREFAALGVSVEYRGTIPFRPPGARLH